MSESKTVALTCVDLRIYLHILKLLSYHFTWIMSADRLERKANLKYVLIHSKITINLFWMSTLMTYF